jgi:hypothetical protein
MHFMDFFRGAQTTLTLIGGNIYRGLDVLEIMILEHSCSCQHEKKTMNGHHMSW